MSALQDFLLKNGRLPGVALTIKPLDGSRPTIEIKEFLTYNFSSSILIPVDTFSFTFTHPYDDASFIDFVQEGDIAILKANEQELATGIIDVIEIETTMTGGEIVTVHGRDLMGQFEDQSAISILDDPIWANKATIKQVIGQLIANTKIQGLRLQDAPAGSYLFATEPGENKIAALQRFLEPLNCLSWADPTGNIVVGRPNMSQASASKGSIVMDRKQRQANVLSIKATRAGTQIPNIIVPIWSGQEVVQSRVGKEQRFLNPAETPSRLLKQGYRVPRAVVVSTPQGSDPQSLSDINLLEVAGSNLLQAYAKREIARDNMKELIVQANLVGHYNDDLTPFLVDQMYDVRYPRANVNEKLYVFQVDYSCTADQGQRTSVYMCRLGRIVADIKVKSVSTEIVPNGALK